MLTPTDIHYIVGLLSKASHPEKVELELGEYVYDRATDSTRDVDVTIKIRNDDGSISIFKGIEVKAHSRKLSSEHVEQLIQKLRDMPDVTYPAIVSASGYTTPAIKKAIHHRVDLYELRAWTPSEDPELSKSIPCPGVRTEYGWAQLPNARINTSQKLTQEEQELLLSNPLVCFEGAASGASRKLQALLHDESMKAAEAAQARSSPNWNCGVKALESTVNLKFTDPPYVLGRASKLFITDVSFTGVVEVRTTEMPSAYKPGFPIFALQDNVIDLYRSRINKGFHLCQNNRKRKTQWVQAKNRLCG